MNQDTLDNAVLDQQLIGSSSNCITPYVSGCWPYTYTCAATGPGLHVEKLPGGFIVTLNGRREVVATAEALADYLRRWSEA